MTLRELLDLLKKHLRLVIALPVVFALVVGIYGFAFMRNAYTATTSMYVLAKAGTSNTVSSSELSASQMLSNDVAKLVDSARVKNDTAAALGMKSLAGYKSSVSSNTTTRVINLSITGADPEVAAQIANAMASSVSSIAREVMSVESVNIVDEAIAPTAPSGPNRPLYVAVAAVAGIFVAVAIVVLRDMLNTKIRTQEELEELLDVPVIGRIPEMKGGR